YSRALQRWWKVSRQRLSADPIVSLGNSRASLVFAYRILLEHFHFLALTLAAGCGFFLGYAAAERLHQVHSILRPRRGILPRYRQAGFREIGLIPGCSSGQGVSHGRGDSSAPQNLRPPAVCGSL